MKKTISTHFLLVLLLLLGYSGHTWAQQYQFSQPSTIFAPLPYAAPAAYKTQFIYYPADFPGMPSGTITTVYIKVNTAVTPNINDLIVKLGGTQLVSFPGAGSTPFLTTLTTCYAGPFTNPSSATNWIVIPLQTPYTYNSADNLLVEFSQTGITTGFNSGYINNNLPARRGIANTYASVNGLGIAQNPLIEIGFDVTAGPVSGVTGVTVATQNSLPATITTNGGSLQMTAAVLPATASQNVNWSIVPGTGSATINTTGLVTAQTDGTVWAKAISVQDLTQMDSLQITISNQVVAVTGLTVTTQNNVPATITTNGGTLQAVATIVPANATNQNVVWSLITGTGSATVSTAGLVTAQTNGTVWVKAISVANPAIKDSLQVTISNQGTGISKVGENSGLEVYPNPVQHELIIKMTKIQTGLTITLVDLLGRAVYTGALNENTLHINMTGIASGHYVLNITGDNIRIQHQILKQ